MRGLVLPRLAGILLVMVVFWAGLAQAGQRHALVIGNADYAGGALGPLKNPTNDAALIADTLRATGFDVTLVMNADLRAMKRAVAAFGRTLEAAGEDAVALFYFSGHGFQASNLNYLAPLGANLQDEVDAEFEAMSVDWVLAKLEAAHRGANIVILDACRNTALSRSFRNVGEGLALMRRTPQGSFISYATAPGSVAADGQGLNSPYSGAIAAELRRPGLTIERVFKNVRRTVVEATAGRQVPWDYSSLTADIVLIPQGTAIATAPAPQIGAMQVELQFWNDVKDSRSVEALQAYLDRFPNGAFVPIARSRIKELQAGGPDAAQIEALFARLTSRALIVENPTRPHEFYANARMRELQGDFSAAREDYLKWIAFEEPKVDPHYRFQHFLKLQEGRAGAEAFYRSLARARTDGILDYATRLLGTRETRVAALEDYLAARPDFAPAVYELSRDFSVDRLGTQSLADKKREKELLDRFLDLVDRGAFLRYFVDQKMAADQIEEARTRLAALSVIAPSALQNPVTLGALRSNQGWNVAIYLADEATEIFVAHSGQPAESTGFLQGMVHPKSGKPLPFNSFRLPLDAGVTPLRISYLDLKGKRHGPFDAVFDPELAKIWDVKAKLELYNRTWVTWRDWEHGLDLHFSTLLTVRCALQEIRWGLDGAPSRRFPMPPCDEAAPHRIPANAKAFERVPQGTQFVSIQLTFRDGTRSDIVRFKRP